MGSIAVTQEEYSVFHAMDIAFYSVLAVELWRNTHESIQTVALWLWFERLGFKNVVQKILSLPCILINELADDALVCCRCVRDPQFLYSAKATDIPLTCSILKETISLEFFHENRNTAIDEIRNVVAEVCATALADVIGEAIKRHSAQKPVKKQNTMSPAVEQYLVHSFADLGFVSEYSKANTNGKRISLAPEQFLVHNFTDMGVAGEIPPGSTHANVVPVALEQSLGHSFDNIWLGGAVSSASSPANVVPSALQWSLDHVFAKMGLKGPVSGGVTGMQYRQDLHGPCVIALVIWDLEVKFPVAALPVMYHHQRTEPFCYIL